MKMSKQEDRKKILDTVKEYAIPITEFEINWLVSISPIKEFLKENATLENS